jgi:hypothetical protein
MLIEKERKTIRARGTLGIRAKDGIPNLFFRKSSIKHIIVILRHHILRIPEII